jgi:hypothetical protein
MTALRNFALLKIVTASEVHYWIMAGAWTALVLLGLWSIFSSPKSLAVRFFWFAAIIFLPIVGLLAYVCSCLIYADWEILKQMGFFSGSKKKIASAIRPA